MTIKIKLECKGEVIGCDECKELCDEVGYCQYCGRPLRKKVGTICNETVAFVKKGHVWNGNVEVKCRFCKSVNII